MHRTSIYSKWLYLFVVLLYAIPMKGQTGLEYWFDEYSDPKLIGMPTAAGTLTSDINVKHLSQGFHTVYFRIQSHGDTYSPVCSSTFLKFSGDSKSYIEYWFENDVEHRGTATLDADSEEMQILDLDLSDVEKFPLGIHQLNMRVAAYGGFYSPIYSSLIVRMPNGSGGSILEYWFDDDISKKATSPINTELGEVQKLDLDLTNAAYFPLGFHKLNMRVASNGTQYSPIYTSYVMKLPVGEASQLTYWLDDNYKQGRSVVVSKVKNGLTAILMPTLDFSSASSGMHRLKFRITSNGIDNGVIYESPVLVTRRYNNDGQVTVTIKNEDCWYDELMHSPQELLNAQSIVTREYILNPSDFEVGQHAFHVQYKNSAEVWSAPNITYFYKEAPNRLRIGVKYADGMDVTDAMDEATSVDDIITEDNSYQIYTLDGAQVDALQKGVNIIRYSNGTSKKVFVK